MARLHITTNSAAGASEVFSYLADFESVAEWDPAVREAVLRHGTPGTTGARYRVVTSILGRSTPLEYEVLETAAPTDRFAGHVVLEAVTAEVRSYIVIKVAAGGHGSTVTYDADLALFGVRRPFDPLLRVALRMAGERTRAGLSAAVQLRRAA